MQKKVYIEKYLTLLRKQRLWQWENYAEKANHDLNQVAREIFEFLKATKEQVNFTGREKQIFQAIYIKSMVENSPSIAALRNKLDDWDHYTVGLNPTNSTLYRREMAQRMRPDVLQLMSERNLLAQEFGFQDYPNLIFFSEDLQKEAVIKMVHEYLQAHLVEAQELIEKYQLTWANWFSQLRKMTALSKERNWQFYLDDFLSKLGLQKSGKKLQYVFQDDSFSGIAIAISIPNDIRILMRFITSLDHLNTLFHETGHGLSYIFNKTEGLFTTWTSIFDESMATLFENIGIEICLEAEEMRISRNLRLLESVRCSISFLFEMALWENPTRPESLFRKYQEILPMEPTEEVLWAIDSFRSIDPVYIHNYVLGEIYSRKIIRKLKENHGDNYSKWGETIVHQFFEDGRKRSLRKKYLDFISQ